MDILGAVAPCMVPDSLPGVLTTSVVNMDNLELAILGIVTRHPMREKELCNELNEWSVGEVHHTLEQLLAQGKVQAINRYGDRFWGSSGSFFGR
jgi:hypothetical protein